MTNEVSLGLIPRSLLRGVSFDGWKDQHSLDVHHVSHMMAKNMELWEKYGLQ